MDFTDIGLTNEASSVQNTFNLTQQHLGTDVARLSSGLRINTPADDPSGLAISQTLMSRVLGFDQASANVQDANNAVSVAEGALSTVSSALQRIRTLAVEANNDFLSDADRSTLQAEVKQLLLEVNKIAESTTFNGQQLLNRAQPDLSGLPVPPVVADGTFITPGVGPNTDPDSWIQDPTGSPWAFTGTAGVTAFGGVNFQTSANLNTPPSGAQQVAYINGTGLVSQTVNGFQAGSYELTFNAAQRATTSSGRGSGTNLEPEDFSVLVDGVAVGTYAPDPGDTSNPSWVAITTGPISLSAGPHTITLQGLDSGGGDDTVFIDDVSLISAPIKPEPLPGLTVQDGAEEGNTVGLDLPTVNTATLGISNVTVETAVDAQTAENAIDAAMTSVDNARASLGAQMTALQSQSDDDNEASTALTASESAIADADIGATTTDYTKTAILSELDSSLLGRIHSSAGDILDLFG